MINKYKAWCRKNKEFISVLGLTFDKNGVKEVVVGYHENPYWGKRTNGIKDVDLLKFSGMQDKNGDDIYEGDCFYTPYINPLGVLDGVDKSAVLVVVTKHGCFGVEGVGRFIPLIEYLELKDGEYIPNYGNREDYGDCYIEIIGNIYENPELLEASK